MENSRTKNTIYNFTTSIGGQLISILMQFIVRTIFIKALGKSYLGINGLFSNILSMLSLTELGVGSAIIFKLYQPIADNNKKRIAELMKFYKIVYRFIGLAVLLIGLLLIPFLPKLIKDYDKLERLNLNASLVFLLYLLQSVSSYIFFSYKSAIIKANQKEYIINIISYFFTIGAGIVQIICLLIIPKFELYVFILIIQVLIQNVVVAITANKLYPYINDLHTKKIDKDEVKGIFKDCSALFLYKINGVVAAAIDNIAISTFIGLEMVGMYSNYYIFFTTISSFLSKIFGAVSHSLGNLHTTKNFEHEYTVFKSVMFISAIIGGTAFVGIAVVADEFVYNWLGSEWNIPQPFSILLGLELYTLAIRTALGKYRTTMGLFQQAKYRPIAGMLINLILSLVLVQFIGVCGVLIGTIAMDWLTLMWYDPIIIHKYGFKNKKLVLDYYKKFIRNFIVSVIVGLLNLIICKSIFIGHGWISVIVHATICGVSVPLALVLISFNNVEGKYVRNLVLKELKFIKKLDNH